jgi:Tfp pilus assembly PilM family ATPase
MYATLSINSRNIRVLSVKGRRVKKWGESPLASGLVRDGLILQPKDVGETVASLFRSTGVPRDKVIVSLGGMAFTYRFISMPRMKPSAVAEAIMRAARKEMSLSLEELYVSWQPLPGQGEEQLYFVLGAPRNLIDALVETLKIAGIQPYLVDLQALALARAANRQDAIVVNMEPDCFDIVFIANGVPAVLHTVNPMREGATLEDNVRRLADELNKMTAFYQSHHPDKTLSQATPLLLTGGLAAEPTAGGLLQSEIGYPVESLSPPLECPPELPVAEYMINIGLAPKKMPSRVAAAFHDININLLSGKYRKPRPKPLRSGQLALWIILVAAIALLYPLYQGLSHLKEENAVRQTEFSNITRGYALASLISEENAQTDNAVRRINADIEALQAANLDLLAGRGTFSRDLQLVTEALPPSTYLTSVESDSETVTVYGETDSVFKVVDYANALESKGPFAEVRITGLDEKISALSGDNVSQNEPASLRRITFGVAINKRG